MSESESDNSEHYRTDPVAPWLRNLDMGKVIPRPQPNQSCAIHTPSTLLPNSLLSSSTTKERMNNLSPEEDDTVNSSEGCASQFRATSSAMEMVHSIQNITDPLHLKVVYDSAVNLLQPLDLPVFYKTLSAMLVEAEESLASFAAEHKSRLDRLTPGDYTAMNIKPGEFKVQVQYSRIEELQARHNQILKKKQKHLARLERLWGSAWQEKLQGLLPPEPSEGLLWRLARFANTFGEKLHDSILREGLQSIINTRRTSILTQKQAFLQPIDIIRFEEKFSTPPLLSARSSNLLSSMTGPEAGTNAENSQQQSNTIYQRVEDGEIQHDRELPDSQGQHDDSTLTLSRKRPRQNSSAVPQRHSQKFTSYNAHIQNFPFETSRTLGTRAGIEDFVEKLKKNVQNTEDVKEIARVEASSVMLKGLSMLAQGPDERLDQKQVMACFCDLWNAARVGTPPLLDENLDENGQEHEPGSLENDTDGSE